MIQKVQKKLKDQRGLTLIELLAVFVILGIIAAIAVVAIGNIMENSKLNAIKADAIQTINAANLYKADTGKLPANFKALKDSGYIESGMDWGTGEPTFDTEDNQTAISGTLTRDDIKIKFNKATIDDINDAKDVKSGGTIGITED